MRTVPELIYAVENLAFGGREIEKSILEEEDYKNYRKIKSFIESKKNTDSRFLKMNVGLKSKLYAAVFSFSLSKSKYSLLQRSIVDIIRLSAIADILLGLGFKAHAIELYNNIYRKSKKYEYTNGVLHASRRLFKQESRKGNIRKAKIYFDDCQNALTIIQNEIKAEWYSSELQTHFAKSKEITTKIKNLAKHHFEELLQIDVQFTSRQFQRDYLTIGIIYFESIFDYQSLCSFLEQSIQRFERQYTQDRTSILMQRLYFINYLLRLNELQRAKDQIEIGFDNCIPKSQQWFRLNELEMLYDLRSNREQECIDKYKLLKSESRLKSLSVDMQNRIELNWLYANISLALKSKKSEARAMLNKIRIGRYLNSIPDFFMDKKGMNIAIIIVQMLYYIILEDLDKLDSRFDAIEKYMSRYMKSDPLYRSQCFVKMLLQIPKQNFHPIAIERHANKYISNLKSLPFLDSHHPIEIEVIEYELLWELLMDFIKNKN